MHGYEQHGWSVAWELPRVRFCMDFLCTRVELQTGDGSINLSIVIALYAFMWAHIVYTGTSFMYLYIYILHFESYFAYLKRKFIEILRLSINKFVIINAAALSLARPCHCDAIKGACDCPSCQRSQMHSFCWACVQAPRRCKLCEDCKRLSDSFSIDLRHGSSIQVILPGSHTKAGPCRAPESRGREASEKIGAVAARKDLGLDRSSGFYVLFRCTVFTVGLATPC